MTRPTEWRRSHFLTTDNGFHSVAMGYLDPGETLVRTVLTLTCYSPVQDQTDAIAVRLAYAINVFGTPTSLPSGTAWPLSDPENYDSPVWWDGMTPETYLYTTAVSPPKEVAMYRPPVGTIDTPVMRLNDTQAAKGLWLQTENGNLGGGASHTAMGYCAYLVKVPAS